MCCLVVAAQYQPAKWRSPRDQRNGRTGAASSNRAVTQSSSGRRSRLRTASTYDSSTYVSA